MKYIYLILCSLIFLISHDIYALTIDVDKCYSIDGPANVRETPNGKIIRSLPYGQSVRVKETQAAWVLIEYSRKKKFSCDSAPDSTSGWTYQDNILPYAQQLAKLVKDGKVLITAEKHLLFYGREINKWGETGQILGEQLIFKGDQYAREDMFGIAVPEHPLLVNIYCLDGNIFENEIMSVEYDMGGDSGTRSVSINMKNKLPATPCIFVNGKLEREQTKRPMTAVPGNITFCKKSETERSFRKIYKGDFNNDGTFEVLVNNGWHGAPWLSRWTLFQIDNEGNKKELGNVGEDGGP